jgi:flagellar protein FlbD
MIELTRLNHHALIVNSDLIKFIEKAPDTVITLVTGEKIVVSESADEVVARLVAFRRRILDGVSFTMAGAALPSPREAGGNEAST